MDRASVDRAACLAGCVPAAPNRRICASLQRRYLCKKRAKYSAGSLALWGGCGAPQVRLAAVLPRGTGLHGCDAAFIA